MPRVENPTISVCQAEWPRDAAAIAGIRRRVFIEEQGVPEALEWETVDADCDWFLARAGEVPVGIARLMPDGRIGRMAVLPSWRGRGVGSRLLQVAVARARARGLARVVLHAQVRAMPFYARHGFLPEGETFMEADIPHRIMTLNLEEN